MSHFKLSSIESAEVQVVAGPISLKSLVTDALKRSTELNMKHKMIVKHNIPSIQK